MSSLKRTFLFVWSFFILFAVVFSFQAESNDQDLAVDLLVEDFKPFVKEFTRDVRIYNHRSRTKLHSNFQLAENGPVDLNDPAFVQYVENRIAGWRAPGHSEGMLGWGLYAVGDPAGSEKYSNSSSSDGWAVIEILLKSGTRFIDLRWSTYDFLFHASKDTLKTLKKVCKTSLPISSTLTHPNGQKYAHIKKTDLASNQICSEIFHEALDTLNVSLIAYDWKNQGIANKKLCTKTRSKTAFVLTQIPQGTEISGYVSELEDTPTAEKEMRYQYVDFLTRSFKGSKAKWDRFKNTNPPSSFETTVKDEKFGCDQYNEDLRF